jgi:hypothetical protein
MKISGALNEFAPAATPSSAQDVLAALRPYLEHVLQRFGAQRLMFGSDWPVRTSTSIPSHKQDRWTVFYSPAAGLQRRRPPPPLRELALLGLNRGNLSRGSKPQRGGQSLDLGEIRIDCIWHRRLPRMRQ